MIDQFKYRLFYDIQSADKEKDQHCHIIKKQQANGN